MLYWISIKEEKHVFATEDKRTGLKKMMKQTEKGSENGLIALGGSDGGCDGYLSWVCCVC